MKSLFVASAGGHLEELYLLRHRLSGGERDVTWATWDTPQSRSLLAGERCIELTRSRPRDLRVATANARLADRLLAGGEFDEVVSTGALPAVPFMAVARARRIPCHFIESAARVGSLSRSGQLVESLPGVRRYYQYPEWQRAGWHHRGSVFDGFRPGPTRDTPSIRRAVVAVGSSRYGFAALVSAAAAALPKDCETTWQTGSTDVADLTIPAVSLLPVADFASALAAADVVICHAGVGSALAALRAGHCPILVPRRAGRGEHVDDHQQAIAAELDRRGLAIHAEVGQLGRSVLEAAASRSAEISAAPEMFRLSDPPRARRLRRRQPDRPGAPSRSRDAA